MPNLAVNPAIGFLPVESGYLACDCAGEYLHELNATGALIAELCDGSRSVEEIRALAAPFLPQGSAAAIDTWMGDAVKAGLLVWTDGPAAPPRQLSADELIALTQNLFVNRRFELAFGCAQKVVELQPDDSSAWHQLGKMAQYAGRRSDAADAYAKYLSFVPEDATVRHLLIALRDETPPPRTSNEYIVQCFQDFSSHYDSTMRENLSYQAPEILQALIAAEIGDRAELAILDIGCGTGLAGVGLKPRAARLVGIDLSPEMLELARAREIYDQLEVAEITEWLNHSPERFDLIVACDCLVYFGDLKLVAGPVAQCLKPGGYFAFTVERGETFPLRLTDSGRFTHHHWHIREVADGAGLTVARLEEGMLRTESRAEVIGLLALLKKT